MSDETLDLSRAMTLLDEAREMCEDLHGQPLNAEGDNNKERMRDNARKSKSLLYAVHIADLARAEILSGYHQFKGETPPRIEP